MDAPAATVGYPADLLDVDVHHVPWIPGEDGVRRSAVDGSGRVEEATSVDAQAHEPAPDRGDGDGVSLNLEFAGDAAGGPLPVTAQLLDFGDQRRVEGGRLVVRNAGPVVQAGIAAGAVPVHPFRQALAGDAGFGGDVRDGTVLTAVYKPQPSGRGERGITVGHAGLPRVLDELVALLILPIETRARIYRGVPTASPIS